MAGRGTRFKDLHPDKPKPLVPLHGQPLVRWVVENLKSSQPQKFIFVCLDEHIREFDLPKLFASWNIEFEIVTAPVVTEGAACSALLAKAQIQNDELIIANSDQFILFNKSDFYLEARKHDGFIMSMHASGNKWSYIRTDDQDRVIQVKEKVQISNLGTVGVYYFKRGDMFITAAEEMVNANDRHNNEFYLAPVYNHLLKSHPHVGHMNIGTVDGNMIGLGTAEDFIKFEQDPRSANLAKGLFL